MFVFKTLLICAVCASAYTQNYGPTTTPVPILKQINRQNDDGSYSFGYEAADGSFKIETKYPNGDVAGKYGYVDESGKVREVSYGASSQRGFEPEGTGIMVPPPTLHDPSSTNALSDGQEDDGQYREDPRIYEDPKYNGRKSKPSSFSQYQQPAQEFQGFQQPEPQPQRYRKPQPAYQPQPNYQQYEPQQPSFSQQTSLFNQSPQQFTQEYRPQSQVFHQQPQFSYQSYTPQPYRSNQYQNYQNPNYQNQNYQNQNYNAFSGHPAQNFDPNTGSYTINFTGK